MSASATFTIVMSSSRMKMPRQTATRVHHLGSRPVLVSGVAAAMVCAVMSSPLWLVFVNSRIINVPNDYLLYDTREIEDTSST